MVPTVVPGVIVALTGGLGIWDRQTTTQPRPIGNYNASGLFEEVRREGGRRVSPPVVLCVYGHTYSRIDPDSIFVIALLMWGASGQGNDQQPQAAAGSCNEGRPV